MREQGRPSGGVLDADRGLTSVLQYVLVLFIVALLISGLIFGFSEVIQDQREQAVRANLEVAGHRIADGFATADRLGANDTTAAVTLDLPGDVAGLRYDVTIRNQGNTSRVVLQTRNPDVTVLVGFVTETPAREMSVQGGTVSVRYDRQSGMLEVVPGE